MAGDVATAGTAGSGVTQDANGHGPEVQDLPVNGNGVAASATAPAEAAGQNGAASGSSLPTVRRRLARFGSSRGSGINPVLEPLIKTARTTHPKADIRLIERAYEVAAKWHAGTLRKSGDPYITHPLAVATILAELGMNHDTLAAALLHDTIEDTDYTLDELRREFGDEVTALVDGVTKLDKVKYGEAAQAETVRKMVVAMSRGHQGPGDQARRPAAQHAHAAVPARPKQEQKSRETLEIYAPLAHRLGMNTVKWELEDLSFATLFPEALRRDRTAGLRARAAPRGVPARGDRRGLRRPARRQDQGAGDRTAEAPVLGVPEDDRRRIRASTTSTTWSESASWWIASGTATRCWGRRTRAGTRCQGGSRTTSRCRSSTCTSRCTRP